MLTSPSNIKYSNTNNVPLTPNNSKLPFVSQIQSENDQAPFYDDSNDEESPIISDDTGQEHDEVAAQLNKAFDESDDYISAKIVSLLNHRYVAGILEFQT